VQYLDFLRRVHEVLEPPTYLEIGIRHGTSLALATSTSVGIDPAFDLRVELPGDTSLFRETSDEYFDRPDPLAPFVGRPPALTFIDGMHLVEYALRDFVNVERHSDWTSVVIFDDIFPSDVDMAARNRHTRDWTGDVYKVLAILARHRRDLICLRVDTEPTGLLLVLGLDPSSSVLDERFDEIVLEAVRPDPQRLPADVLERRDAIGPEDALAASFWSFLRDAREARISRRKGLRRLRGHLERDLGRPVRRPLAAGAFSR
jgi:hypothetical protein